MTERKISLFYSDLAVGGTSDKEYRAQTERSGSGFVVNFQFGRRGGTLQTGTKTPTPVIAAEAERIFNRIVAEKKGKGYRENGMTADAPVASATNGESKRSAFPVELLDEITEREALILIQSDKYWMQVKANGRRLEIEKTADGFIGYNKKGEPVPLPSPLVASLKKLPLKSFHMDGELIADRYVVWDLFTLNGKTISTQAYSARFPLLEGIVSSLAPLVIAIETWRTPKEKAKGLRKLKLDRCEGAVFKLISASYRAGRNGHKKFKFVKSCTCKVIRTGDKGHNSATLALRDGPKWREVGNASLNGKDPRIAVGSLVEVLFLYATEGNRLYQPRIKELRDDVNESECTMAQLATAYQGRAA